MKKAYFEGREFWSGCVSLIDGIIEEVHTYKEAEYADFHHSMYFTPESAQRMDTEESAFFYVDDGTIMEGCRESLPQWIIASIKKQIQIM